MKNIATEFSTLLQKVWLTLVNFAGILRGWARVQKSRNKYLNLEPALLEFGTLFTWFWNPLYLNLKPDLLELKHRAKSRKSLFVNGLCFKKSPYNYIITLYNYTINIYKGKNLSVFGLFAFSFFCFFDFFVVGNGGVLYNFGGQKNSRGSGKTTAIEIPKRRVSNV